MRAFEVCAASLLFICMGSALAVEPTLLVRCEAPHVADDEALRRSLALYLQEFSPTFVGGSFDTLEAEARAQGAGFAVWCEFTDGRTFHVVLLDLGGVQARTSDFELSASETAGSDFARLAGLKVRSLISLAQFKNAPAVAVSVTPPIERAEPRVLVFVGPEWSVSNAFTQSLFGVGGQVVVRVGAFRVGLGARWHQPELNRTADASGVTLRLTGAVIAAWQLPDVALFSHHFAAAQLGAQRLVTTGTLVESGEGRSHTGVLFMVSVSYLMSWRLFGPMWLSVGPRLDVLTAPVAVYVRETPVFRAPLASPALELHIGVGL